MGLRMQEEAAAPVEPTAVVAEESTSEEIALKKTSIAKSKPAPAGAARGAPRGDKKNKKPLTEYTIGSTVEGKVINIMPYGAFVDIGATTDGLVHVSQATPNIRRTFDQQ
jgi:elongation factor Ts